MSVNAVINLATGFDVLMVGLALAIIPRVTRRGLLFGVYVGEERSRGEDARALVRRWHVGTGAILLGALSVGYGLSAAGRALLGNRMALLVLGVGSLALYLTVHLAARRLVPEGRGTVALAAPLVPEDPSGLALPLVALVVSLLVGTAVSLYSASAYGAMPARIPVHFGAGGQPDAWAEKSLPAVMLLPLLGLFMGPVMAFMALLTARAKRSVRRTPDERSLRAQRAFRTAVVRMLCGCAVLYSALLGVMGVQVVRVRLGEIQGLGSGVWWFGGLTLVFTLGYLVRLAVHHGQGGALQEDGESAPLTNGLADDSHWVLGVIYFDRDDPSILVEKRVGIGYTVNFGNRWGVAIVALIVLGSMSLLALSYLAVSRGG